jgi:amino acid efflux transporter
MVVVVGIAEIESLKGKSLIHIAEMFMSRPLVLFFSIAGALVACATTINVIFSTVARGLMVVSLDRLFPAAMGRVSQRFGTPHIGLTVSYMVSAIALVTIPSLLFFGSMLNLGLIVAITLVAVAGLVFPKRYPERFARSGLKFSPWVRKAACIAVIAVNCLIFLFFCLAVGRATFVFFGIAVAAAVYTFSRRSVLKSFQISAVLPGLNSTG